jgi:two-component sensor histidine kinase/multisubunit Na+/H+ antiporter MnhC subunit
MKTVTGQDPPPATRTYWICQIAGWASFVVWVTAFYVVYEPHARWDVIASIVVIDGGVTMLITHGVRRWMYRHGWIGMRATRLLPRLVLSTIVLSVAITALIVLTSRFLPDSTGYDRTAAFWTFIAFLWAFGGWLLIYTTVHTRRQHDARALELTLNARDAQLQLLRAQLNPHFLFNCLNSLRGLISENPERASAMVTSLSDLLRYSLRSDRAHTVPLAEEMEIVNEYISLERVRFEERLRFETDVAPAALGVAVPPMLVQTLVENAVKHGIADRADGGVVRLRAEVSGRRIAISVTNTGLMRAPMNENGHGLRNTIDRLRILYGDEASLTLTDASGQTVASVSIPLESGGERAAG